MIGALRGIDTDDRFHVLRTPVNPGQRGTLPIVIEQAHCSALERVMRGDIGGNRRLAAPALRIGNNDSF